MEFMNRGAAQPAARVNGNGGVAAPSGGKKGSRWKDSPMWLRVVWVVLLFSITIVVVALAALLYFGGPNEAKHIDKDKKQAVFLTNGQVYFGEIKNVNSKFLDLRNIYYLNVNQQVQPNQNADKDAQSSISLVKLGCELHGPVDKMIVNRDQVTFWENLKDDGQVAKAIAEWVKQNPDGQKCQTATSNTNTDSNQ
jgi:hypothetical protein